MLVRSLIASLPLCLLVAAFVSAEDKTKKVPLPKPDKDGWISLFDGKSLHGWKATNFGGEGEVEVKDGELILNFGSDLTGVSATWDELPTMNYEITLQAMRVDGSDFFCGLTFPVAQSHCSLILGGWGGGVCGLSSIDNMDASENETTSYRDFNKKTWYDVRVVVTEKKIEAWLGKEKIVNQNTEDRKISTRAEVELSRPLGLCSWQTTAAVKNIKIRPLSDKKGE